MTLIDLPALRTERAPWQSQAACAGVDPDLFYPDRGESTDEAKAVCGACDVRETCLEYALTNRERFGIWGGASENERRVLRRARHASERGTSPVVIPQITDRFRMRPWWTVPQLCAALGFSNGAVTRAINTLATQGLVTLRGDSIDSARVWEWVAGDE